MLPQHYSNDSIDTTFSHCDTNPSKARFEQEEEEAAQQQDFFILMNANSPNELLSSPIGAIDGDVHLMNNSNNHQHHHHEHSHMMNDDDASMFSDICMEEESSSIHQQQPPQHRDGKTRPKHATHHMAAAYAQIQPQQSQSQPPTEARHPNANTSQYHVHMAMSQQPQQPQPQHPSSLNPQDVERFQQRGWRENDVPLGRSQEVREFVGNLRYRALVDEHRVAYHSAAKRSSKTEISNLIFATIRARGGRFLDKKIVKAHGSAPRTEEWFEISSEKALAKVSQALRIPASTSLTSPASPFASASSSQSPFSHSRSHSHSHSHYAQNQSSSMFPPPMNTSHGGFWSPSVHHHHHHQKEESTMMSSPMSPPRPLTGMEISVPQGASRDHVPTQLQNSSSSSINSMSPMSPPFNNNNNTSNNQVQMMDISSNTVVASSQSHAHSHHSEHQQHHQQQESSHVYMPHWSECSNSAVSEESSSCGSKRRRAPPSGGPDHPNMPAPRPDLFRHRSSEHVMDQQQAPVSARPPRRSSDHFRPRPRRGQRSAHASSLSMDNSKNLMLNMSHQEHQVRQTRSFTEGDPWEIDETFEKTMQVLDASQEHYERHQLSSHSSWQQDPYHGHDNDNHWPPVRTSHSFTQGEARPARKTSLQEHFERYPPASRNNTTSSSLPHQLDGIVSCSISEEWAVDHLVEELNVEPTPVPTVRRSKLTKKKGPPSVADTV